LEASVTASAKVAGGTGVLSHPVAG